MTDLGLHDFQLKIVDALGGGFEWYITFFLAETGRYYMSTGIADSIEQGYAAGMSFLAERIREAA